MTIRRLGTSASRFVFVVALVNLLASPARAGSGEDEGARAADAPTVAPPTPPLAPSFETVIPPPAAPSAGPAPAAASPAVVAAAPLPLRRSCDSPEPMREGFYLRLLQGNGYTSFHGSGPHGAASASGVASHSTVAIGGALIRGLALAGTVASEMVETDFHGGPFTGATISADGNTALAVASTKAKVTHVELGALLDWYPDPLKGFHAGLSAGLGAVSLQIEADGSSQGGTATSGALFAGYDFALTRSWAFGLALVASGVTAATLKSSSGDETGYKLHAYSISIAASMLYF